VGYGLREPKDARRFIVNADVVSVMVVAKKRMGTLASVIEEEDFIDII